MNDSREKNASNHLLHQISDVIEERGTIFVDIPNDMIVSNEEYISPYSVVA